MEGADHEANDTGCGDRLGGGTRRGVCANEMAECNGLFRMSHKNTSCNVVPECAWHDNTLHTEQRAAVVFLSSRGCVLASPAGSGRPGPTACRHAFGCSCASIDGRVSLSVVHRARGFAKLFPPQVVPSVIHVSAVRLCFTWCRCPRRGYSCPSVYAGRGGAGPRRRARGNGGRRVVAAGVDAVGRGTGDVTDGWNSLDDVAPELRVK